MNREREKAYGKPLRGKSVDFDELMDTYIKPFEEAGYNVKAVFRSAKPNEAAARVVSRELRNGRIISVSVRRCFSFGSFLAKCRRIIQIAQTGKPIDRRSATSAKTRPVK